MRNFVFGIVLSFLLLGAGTWAYRVYQWRYYQNVTAWGSIVTYQWLAQPIYTDKSGKSFTRAQILDALAQEAAKNAQQK